jgi:hypothetical protein
MQCKRCKEELTGETPIHEPRDGKILVVISERSSDPGRYHHRAYRWEAILCAKCMEDLRKDFDGWF